MHWPLLQQIGMKRGSGKGAHCCTLHWLPLVTRVQFCVQDEPFPWQLPPEQA